MVLENLNRAEDEQSVILTLAQGHLYTLGWLYGEQIPFLFILSKVKERRRYSIQFLRQHVEQYRSSSRVSYEWIDRASIDRRLFSRAASRGKI
jgi:hypothetical protein